MVAYYYSQAWIIKAEMEGQKEVNSRQYLLQGWARTVSKEETLR